MLGQNGTFIVNGFYEYWTNNSNYAPSEMTGRTSFNAYTSTFAGVRYVKFRSIKAITSAEITVTTPVTGATPSTTADVNTANFTAGTVTWSPVATTFATNTAYTATVTLTADDDHVFADTLSTATINGETATVTNNTGETVTLSYTFDKTATEISSASINITAPEKGATPSTTATVGGANFTAGTVSWSPVVTTFAASTAYTVTVTLTDNNGYVFADTLTTATINGETATVTGNTGETVTLSYTFDATATEIASALINITAPVKGATPSTAANVGGANFTAGTVSWSPVATTFAASTAYTATVTLTANNGYVFTDTLTTATINGETATVSNNTGEKTVTLSYTFDATATEIASASINITAPEKGATPSTAANVGGANFTAGTVSWSPVATTFAASTAYTVTVTLTANNGYVFADTLTTATINGETATVTGNTGSTVTLTYTFDKTAVAPGGSSTPSPSPVEPEASKAEEPKPEPTPTSVFNINVINLDALVKNIEALVIAANQTSTTTEFTDTDKHWAKDTIDTFIALQLIQGYEDGTYRPNDPITRAEFSTMLSRVFNIQIDNSNNNVDFKDLDNHWAKDTITSLAALGIITGYEDGTFKPEKTITREEMVIMLSRIVNLDSLTKDTSKGYFTDLNQSYTADDIKATSQAGIVNGRSDDLFDPKGISTRAEALQIIVNALSLDPQVKALLDSLN